MEHSSQEGHGAGEAMSAEPAEFVLCCVREHHHAKNEPGSQGTEAAVGPEYEVESFHWEIATRFDPLKERSSPRVYILPTSY